MGEAINPLRPDSKIYMVQKLQNICTVYNFYKTVALIKLSSEQLQKAVLLLVC